MAYFTVAEFTHSDNAVAAKVDNTPDAQSLKNIHETIEAITPFRVAWGAHVKATWPGEKEGINITSGYRNDWVNTKAGGVSTSAHKVGWAADMQPANGRRTEFQKFAQKYWSDVLKAGVKFDQVILEGLKGKQWVHFGLKNQSGAQRCSVFALTD